MSALECPKCGTPLVERAASGQTPEQRFCGTWFDHAPVPVAACMNTGYTVLEPSSALLAQHQSMSTLFTEVTP